ncbi:SDR family NAD(P)-dependent oxidoreductase [Microvirga antarctica]|uniref:SDR family NAD(P)-dependent oxidoreductase n=1 Tax=Microvirga antarctica TaxID=2819233 RepID=UPI001B30E349|nr:SDR family NAD(P)-dependent oxidoreductase [Microvirga antarctica]
MTEATLSPDNRVIMISGASRGIGAAIAKRLLADGYRLSLGARKPDVAKDALGDHDPERVLFGRFDALDPSTSERWVSETVEKFGQIDGLVNNAGILRQVLFDGKGEAALEELWGVNVVAPYRLTCLTLPHLRKTGQGRIVNIASTDGKRYRDTVSVGYAMTKHALVVMSHASKFEGWEDGVRVTALCPGAVDTDLIAGIPGVMPGPGRITPSVIAHGVSFILSLPNNASVAEFAINTRLESTL